MNVRKGEKSRPRRGSCYTQVTGTLKTTKEPIPMQTHKGLYYDLPSKDSHCLCHSGSEMKALSLEVQDIY